MPGPSSVRPRADPSRRSVGAGPDGHRPGGTGGRGRAGQLAEQTNLTTGAITSMIRRLKQAGYVTAERDPADQRRVIITLVPGSVESGTRLYASFGQAMAAVVSGYGIEELRLLARHYDEMSAVYQAQLAGLRHDGATGGDTVRD
ncbi:MarR family transcriptional regulator [Plantactinospora sp. GCM10030261]|uniref:MarR family transcriptional regulator n=1 Tax=Plantactinospora sp. GCM10030261 TaxID=3273420 RepID=UPI00361C2AEF